MRRRQLPEGETRRGRAHRSTARWGCTDLLRERLAAPRRTVEAHRAGGRPASNSPQKPRQRKTRRRRDRRRKRRSYRTGTAQGEERPDVVAACTGHGLDAHPSGSRRSSPKGGDHFDELEQMLDNKHPRCAARPKTPLHPARLQSLVSPRPRKRACWNAWAAFSGAGPLSKSCRTNNRALLPGGDLCETALPVFLSCAARRTLCIPELRDRRAVPMRAKRSGQAAKIRRRPGGASWRWRWHLSGRRVSCGTNAGSPPHGRKPSVSRWRPRCGGVSDGYGARTGPLYRGSCASTTGLDLACAAGTAVRAVQGGVVDRGGPTQRQAMAICLQSCTRTARETRYAHLQYLYVRTGERWYRPGRRWAQ